MPLIIQGLTLKAACWSAYEKAPETTALVSGLTFFLPARGLSCDRTNRTISQKESCVFAGTKSAVKVITFPTRDVRWGA